MIKRMKKAGVASVMLGALCFSAISVPAGPVETYDINVKKIEIAAEANDSSAAVIKEIIVENKAAAEAEKEQLESELASRMEAELIAQEEAARAEQEAIKALEASQAVVSNDAQASSYEAGSSGVLTKSGGVNYFNGVKETYYSQRVLPGGGLNIPGRHVAADGTIRDEAEYIVVASDVQGKGETGMCSLGAYKVYDTGVGHNGIDIYTDW